MDLLRTSESYDALVIVNPVGITPRGEYYTIPEGASILKVGDIDAGNTLIRSNSYYLSVSTSWYQKQEQCYIDTEAFHERALELVREFKQVALITTQTIQLTEDES